MKMSELHLKNNKYTVCKNTENLLNPLNTIKIHSFKPYS